MLVHCLVLLRMAAPESLAVCHASGSLFGHSLVERFPRDVLCWVWFLVVGGTVRTLLGGAVVMGDET